MPAGWLLHDLAMLVTSGRPELALEVLPSGALILAGGAVFGLLAGWRPWVPLSLLVAGAAALLPRLVDWSFSTTAAWLPRAVFLMAAAFALSSGRGGARARPWRGLALGFLGALLLALLRLPPGSFAWPALLVALVRGHFAWPAVLAALALIALGRVRAGGPRRALRALVVLALLAWWGPGVLAALSPTRPDLAPPASAPPAGATSLVLVVLDTVRADHLAPYGYGRETTPSLDRRVREQFTLYENARSTSSWTLPSHASLFTGLFPAQHGAAPPGRHALPVRDDVPTLAEILRGRGWRTAAIFSNNVYLRADPPGERGHAFGMERGFEHFDDRLAGSIGPYLTLAQLFGCDPRSGHLHYRDAESITDLAIRWLDRRAAGPFFLALNYMEAHSPNMPPPPFDRAFGGERARDPLAPDDDLQVLLYDRELAYLDRELERLLAALEERGLWDDTAVFVTSDHGEGLGDHGFLYHGWVLYDALVHVPLYVKPAGGRQRERAGEDVSGAEVFHMILREAGIESSAAAELAGLVSELYVNPKGIGGMERRTGLDLERNLLAWKEGSTKTIVSSQGVVEAFDLAADPGERAPLAQSAEDVARALERARAWWRAWPVELDGAGELDPQALERLRDLGYLGE